MKTYITIIFVLFILASVTTMIAANDKFAALGVIFVAGIYMVARITMGLNSKI